MSRSQASPPVVAAPDKGGEFCSSSTLLDQACSSTLRSRLRTHDSAPQPFLASEGDSGEEVLRRFRACFALDPVPSTKPQAKDAKIPAAIEAGAMAQLGETFAEAGLRFYTAVAEEIVQARRDMDSQIAKLSEESAAVLSRADALYSNVTYPLSATLCHVDNGPSATIAAHLSALRANLSAAQGELEGLQNEWESCIKEERQTLMELKAMDAKRANLVQNGQNDGVKCAVDGFRDEAKAVLEASEEELDEIDAEFKELMQGETMKMMQSMMAS